MKAVRFVIRTGSPAILQLLKGLLSNYEIVLNAHHENSITIMNCQQKEFSTSFNNEISQTSQISRAQSPHQSFPPFCIQCFSKVPLDDTGMIPAKPTLVFVSGQSVSSLKKVCRC